MTKILTIRCTHCWSEFSDEELEGALCCPTCKSNGIPCQIAEDVTIKINWHELRILGIWADNYSHSSGMDPESAGIVAKIIQRIEIQHPSMSPLTLGGEIKKLQETYPGAGLLRGDDVQVKPRKAN